VADRGARAGGRGVGVAPRPAGPGVGGGAGGFWGTWGQGGCRYYDGRQANLLAKPLELPAGLWDNHLHLMA